MNCRQVCSVKADVSAAVQEVRTAFAGENPELVLFFSDSGRFVEFSAALHELYPHAAVAGAATCASFSPAGACRFGLNAAALSGLRVSAGLIGEIRTYPMKYMSAVADAVRKMGPAAGDGSAVCFLLTPAGSYSEELVLDTLADALEGTGIPVAGGAASSEEILRGAVSLNGRVCEDESVFVFIRPEQGRLNIALENIFRPMGRGFTVTKADVENRTIYELDGHPAADVLCRALDVPFGELAAALATHPLGRVPADNLFINEVRSVNQDRSISTYCRVFNHTPVALLELRDLRSTLEETMASVREAMPSPVFSIVVNCFRRTCIFFDESFMPEFTDLLGSALGSYIGLTSFGEQLNSYQLSMSMVIVSFSEEQR